MKRIDKRRMEELREEVGGNEFQEKEEDWKWKMKMGGLCGREIWL